MDKLLIDFFVDRIKAISTIAISVCDDNSLKIEVSEYRES